MKTIYRLTMVVWKDCTNTDTDYLEDFDSLEEAKEYVDKNKQSLLLESLDYDEYQAVDLDIEEWVGEDCVGVVWSTELWAKEEQRTKNFIEEIKKSFRQHHINDCDTLCKVYDHRFEMFDETKDIISYFEQACKEYAVENGWEIEFGLHLGLNKIRGKK